ncbi:hypothetical protein [Halorubrum tebenquichense]|uniref:HMA domain-containing protein n=1 Tax=Halorubrum tebenquichense DSM 14210 TaxID=1227485 RepID=M0E162_9EURY|nr:hypothetical protein [Halorubrum tebenquichense]ELZ40697.1 hypothetical protein C472_01494 [Halorubrum tebenquichense DSM 14210]
MTDDDLVEAVEKLPDADPDSLVQLDDGRGHFVFNVDADEQDVDEIDEVLAEAGYERNGHLPVPGMVQQNFRPIEDEDGGAE